MFLKDHIHKRLEKGFPKFDGSQKRGIVFAVMVKKMNEIF